MRYNVIITFNDIFEIWKLLITIGYTYVIVSYRYIIIYYYILIILPLDFEFIYFYKQSSLYWLNYLNIKKFWVVFINVIIFIYPIIQ